MHINSTLWTMEPRAINIRLNQQWHPFRF